MNLKLIRPRRGVAGISRRAFFNSAGVAGAGQLAASAAPKGKGDRRGESECAARSICESPHPIPHLSPTPFGVSLHNFFPGPVEGTVTPTDPAGAHPDGRDPSLIYNFDGFIGEADLILTGIGTDLETGATAVYSFHTHMRFMKGVFVGTDGKTHKGAFAFI